MKYTNMSIIHLLYKVFIILEIKVALINYCLSKVASKAALNNGLITLISPHSAPCWQYPGGNGVWANRWWLPQQTALHGVVGLMGCSPLCIGWNKFTKIQLLNVILLTTISCLKLQKCHGFWLVFQLLLRWLDNPAIRGLVPMVIRLNWAHTVVQSRPYPFSKVDACIKSADDLMM